VEDRQSCLSARGTDRIVCPPLGAAKPRVPNKPGSLFCALGAFAVFDIDLSKIESRPVEGRPWEYVFYLDIIGREGDPKVEQALQTLRAMAELVKIFGCYPTRW
jgi:prephenate dehydratase